LEGDVHDKIKVIFWYFAEGTKIAVEHVCPDCCGSTEVKPSGMLHVLILGLRHSKVFLALSRGLFGLNLSYDFNVAQ
jgi:hypothetical protein